MKKFVLLFCSAVILFNSSCTFNKKVGSIVRKKVSAEGKTYVKNLKISEWSEFDAQGRKICTKYSNGSEYIFDYDETGTKMHTVSFFNSEKDSESWSELDSKGNVIYEKDSNEIEQWFEYDDKNRLIHLRYNSGIEAWYEFNGTITEVYTVDNDGKTSTATIDNGDEYFEYDSCGNKIYFKNSGGYEEWYEYTFWQDGTVKTKTTYTKPEDNILFYL